MCWEFQGGACQKTCILVLDFWFRETMGLGGGVRRVCVYLWNWIFISSYGVTGAIRSLPHSSKAWGFLRKLDSGVWCLPLFNSLHTYLWCASSVPVSCAKNWNVKTQKTNFGFYKFNRGLTKLCYDKEWPSKNWQLLVILWKLALAELCEWISDCEQRWMFGIS